MKTLFDSFRKYINEASLGSYIKNSTITLYHYSSANDEEITLDPQHFGKSSYSRRERESSTIPRIFFYVDLSQREPIVATGRNLYAVNIHENMLYDLYVDPEGYKEAARHPVYGLRKGIELDDLLNKIKEKYSGIFYTSGQIDIVAWFEPITVKKISDEERKKLEG